MLGDAESKQFRVRMAGSGGSNPGPGGPTGSGPSASSTPPGTIRPVSAALQIPAPMANDLLRTAVAIIDSVHTDGALPTLPAEVKANLGASYGMYSPGVRVEVLSSGPWPLLTSLHEIGHFLDHYGIGTPGQFASISDPVLDAWKQAVDASATVQRLCLIIAQSTVTGTDARGRPILIPLRPGYIAYLLDPWELWARSYAQYIAGSSANAEALRQLNICRNEMELQAIGRQWPDNDFAAIAQAIEAVLKGLGWKP